ncbi:MAG: molybdenum cofactor biosynthesis protein MoaE [Gammaproteobacteria bacterium]|nr:molybdenum cofactor biosynthesis protein MoaE [Gammaproteobacteria bacterium]
MKVIINSDCFDPWQRLNQFQSEMPDTMQGSYGATAVFVGTMRDFNEGDDVSDMFLEHYPGMTERYLENICLQATKKYDLLESLIVHRVGHIKPNDSIVLVAVWTEHRKQAFIACRDIMENLKSKAPFWKKEQLNKGQIRWVEKNTQG